MRFMASFEFVVPAGWFPSYLSGLATLQRVYLQAPFFQSISLSNSQALTLLKWQQPFKKSELDLDSGKLCLVTVLLEPSPPSLVLSLYHQIFCTKEKVVGVSETSFSSIIWDLISHSTRV